MCDTLVVRKNGVTWFAKNSDREPDEAQGLLWLPPTEGDTHATIQTTYIDVAQQPRRYGVLLSKPAWLWGAEMGVNTEGVAIGNEAVFSKLVSRETSLLGMDLLRLGLERGATARQALDVIVWHLERYGQGGPAGFRDKKFRYDNSFLIADANESWVLETAGRLWAAKKVESWAISNCYSLTTEFDLCSANLEGQARSMLLWSGKGDFNFARTFDTRLYAFIGGAHGRRHLNAQALACGLEPGWASLAARLRDHGTRGSNYSAHDNRQVCLHAGSLLRPSQTTASLIARLEPQKPVRVAATGTSAPCMALFQPLPVGPELPALGTVVPGAKVGDTPWAQFEPVHHRALFDPAFLQALQADRDALESALFAMAEQTVPPWSQMAAQAQEWRALWRSKALVGASDVSGRLGRWWHRCAQREIAQSEGHFRA